MEVHTPQLSVIIPVFNGEGTLRACLQAATSSRGIRAEVIVVDDCSTDGTKYIASRFPVRLIALEKRVGGGSARNLGAAEAKAPILIFTDADVELLPDTLKGLYQHLQRRVELSAVFGAYSEECPAEGFLSQYKNLHHHYVHLTSRREATTFWTGCGAVRAEAFWAVGGFQQDTSIYDIDFGYRLVATGRSIALVPEIQVKHHKHYSLFTLVHSEIFQRAIPWTKLMWKHRLFINDLNTRWSHTASTLVLGCSLIWVPVAKSVALGILGVCVGLLGSAAINWRWAVFCYRHRGLAFAIKATAMEWVYFLCCGVGAIMGTVLFFSKAPLRRIRVSFGLYDEPPGSPNLR